MMQVRVLVITLLLLCTTSYAQLGDFTLDVTKTDETCLGNGTLTFSTTNTNPLASLQYAVYKYPDLVVPVHVLTANVLGGLNAGTYKVVANQLLNEFSNSQSIDITINHVDIPILFDIVPANSNCGQGGQITFSITQGTVVSYEIISGPVIMPLQSSNIFAGIPNGTYNIRMFDECGQGEVITYTLTLSPPAGLEISDAIYTVDQNGSCNVISVTNTITAPQGTIISYPVTVEVTINPPGGPPIIETHVFPSGNPSEIIISRDFDIFPDDYTYSIKVSESCAQYFRSGIVFQPDPSVKLDDEIGLCGKKFLTIAVQNFKAPYFVSFTNFPPGFDPAQFNNQNLGPFTAEAIYGSEENPVPEGIYTIVITDACSRTATDTLDVKYLEPDPSAIGRNNGCFAVLGRINISIPERDVVVARVVSAPAEYTLTHMLPEDISPLIVNGRIIMLNVPLGNYEFEITDDCAIDYKEVDVIVPAFVEKEFTISSLSDCGAGNGAVRMASGNGRLQSVTLTLAPASYGNFPADVSMNIDASGLFFMGNLPEGNYEFTGIDVCGIQHAMPISVSGYVPDTHTFTHLPHCGSFDIDLHDNADDGSTGYWLQEFNETAQRWEHPVTGVAYTEGTVPDTSSAMALSNNSTTHNFTVSGIFRILKSFGSYDNGVSSKSCVENLGGFSYSMGLKIANVYNLSCNGHPDDVYIDAVNGLQPYIYRIKKKDAIDFPVDNGNNSVFTGLQPGIYHFEVEDSCGNQAPSIVNINTLPSLVDAATPNDMVVCAPAGSMLNNSFDIRSLDAEILEGQSQALYTVSYHASQQDADDNVDTLPDTILNTINNQPVYARVVHNNIPICHRVVMFKLVAQEKPVLNMDLEYYMCDDSPIQVTAPVGFDEYDWSTGAIGRTTLITSPGTYTLSVSNLHDGFKCTDTKQVTVFPSGPATILAIETSDWTDEQNTITIIAGGDGQYEYSIDGTAYQESNIFEGLPTGIYTVYVKDKNDCGIVDREVALMNYPKYFTPNDDGYNDRWRIKFSFYEPGMKIYIYDKYGKLITGFNGMYEGWDGKLNGSRLPSTDYWFVVERADGKIYKGHFSMMR